MYINKMPHVQYICTCYNALADTALNNDVVCLGFTNYQTDISVKYSFKAKPY